MTPTAPDGRRRAWAYAVVGAALVGVLAGTGVWWASAARQADPVADPAPTRGGSAPITTTRPTTAPPAATPSTQSPTPSPTTASAKPKPPKRKPKPAVDPNRLKIGDESPHVAAVQRRLAALGYQPGPVDGVFGGATQQAVWAFQHVNRIGADGVVGPRTARALARPAAPKPFAAYAGRNRIEVDIARQFMVLYQGGRVRLITHVSSGNGQEFCDGGRCRRARTPRGSFRVVRKIPGWRVAELGRLYNPVYFTGPYALHGSHSVPNFPASHGCIRVPMRVAEMLPKLAPMGMPVIVR